MARYFLVSTEHFSDRILFQNEDDFKVAMNMVAVAAYVTGAVVLDFILMSNHVHFVVKGSEEKVKLFVTTFKRLYGRYLASSQRVQKIFKRNAIDIRPVWKEDESLKRAIAYVHMNSVAANICLNPQQYPWGCGGIFFNKRSSTGTEIGSISIRAQHRLTHSNVSLPADYIITSEGFIAPESYVPVEAVEQLFGTAKSLQFFLNQSSKAKARLEGKATPSFRDHVIASSIQDLCNALFRKYSIDELSKEEKSELLKQLRFRFSSDLTQLSRVTSIPYSEAAALLEEQF